MSGWEAGIRTARLPLDALPPFVVPRSIWGTRAHPASRPLSAAHFHARRIVSAISLLVVVLRNGFAVACARALPRSVQNLDLPEIVVLAYPATAVLTVILFHAQDLRPVRLLLVSVARWLGQQQRDAIDYLREENQVLGSQPVPSGTSSSESEPPSTPPAASFHGLEDCAVCLLKQEVLEAVSGHHCFGVVNLTALNMLHGESRMASRSPCGMTLGRQAGSSTFSLWSSRARQRERSASIPLTNGTTTCLCKRCCRRARW